MRPISPPFSLIQNSATSGAIFIFFAFDILQLRGVELTGQTLKDCRDLLRKCLKASDTVQLSESSQIPAKQMFELVRKHGLEGVGVAPHQHLRTRKAHRGMGQDARQAFQNQVIGGVTPAALMASMLSLSASKETNKSTSAGASTIVVSQPAAAFFTRNSLHSKRRPAIVNLPEKSAGR